MLLRHQERLDLGKIKIVIATSFLMGFVMALLSYVLSSYFKLIFHTNNVGVFFAIAYAIVLLCLLHLHKLVKELGKVKMFHALFLARLFFTGLLIFLPPSYLSAAILILYIVVANLSWVNLDIILEAFSIDKMSGRIRGLGLTVGNIGFILGPFLSTRLLDCFHFQGIFVAAFIAQLIIFLFTWHGFRGIKHRFHHQESLTQLFHRIFKRTDILKIYYISFVLEFFYSFMVIYTPLYLLSLGLTWKQLGVVFSIMLVPFVTLQYPAGLIADKKTGEKYFLIFALLIMGIFTFCIYENQTRDLVLWTIILFGTRVGASLIEVLRDSYFYKRIDGRDIDLINFFRTSRPVAYIFSTLVSSLFLFVFPLRATFLFLTFVVFSGIVPALFLERNKIEAEYEASS